MENHKYIIENNLCKEIIKNHRDIIDELKIILKQNSGYKHNNNKEKLKKHFPAFKLIPYDKTMITVGKTKDNKIVSCSISSKDITEQLNNILLTAERRYNLTNTFNDEEELLSLLITKHKYNLAILSPLDNRNNLIKYDNEEQMRNKFPGFIDKKTGRFFFNVIYIIKTENPYFYINKTNKTFCDSILICCKDKTFNIMFELDTNNPYYPNLNYKYNEHNEQLIKDIYNNSLI